MMPNLYQKTGQGSKNDLEFSFKPINKINVNSSVAANLNKIQLNEKK